MSTPLVSRWAVQSLEQVYPPLLSVEEDTMRPIHIVVLGAGKNNDPRLPPNVRLMGDALSRLIEGLRHYQAGEDRVLITSGPIGRGEKTQAAIMREAAMALGADSSRIHLLEDVVNTRTEAARYTRLHGTEAPLILCTSASHLPRAVRWFRYYGVTDIRPAPALYLAPVGERVTWRWLMPSLTSLVLWRVAFHEYAGMVQQQLWMFFRSGK